MTLIRSPTSRRGSHLSLSPKDVESFPSLTPCLYAARYPGKMSLDPVALSLSWCSSDLTSACTRLVTAGDICDAIVLAQISRYSLASSEPEPSLLATAWGRMPASVGRIAS